MVFEPFALSAGAEAFVRDVAGALAFVVFVGFGAALVTLVDGAFALGFVVEAFVVLAGALVLDTGFLGAGVVFYILRNN